MENTTTTETSTNVENEQLINGNKFVYTIQIPLFDTV